MNKIFLNFTLEFFKTVFYPHNVSHILKKLLMNYS